MHKTLDHLTFRCVVDFWFRHRLHAGRKNKRKRTSGCARDGGSGHGRWLALVAQGLLQIQYIPCERGEGILHNGFEIYRKKKR